MRASIWLVPTAAPAARLRTLIATLAQRLGAPPFDPHITLIGDLELELDPAGAALAALSSATAPLELATAGLGAGDERFEALYIRLIASAPLLNLRRALGKQLSIELPAAWHPHVSLVYPEAPLAKEALLAEGGALTIDPAIRCDHLALVAPGTGDWHDVGNWRQLATFPLAGG